MVEFENPWAFSFLILILALYFLRYLKVFRGVAFPLVLGDWNGEYFEWQRGLRLFFRFLMHFCGVCAFVCVVIAYANPVVRHQKKVYSSRGADIMFVVDVSPSMAARDIAGMSRLEAAKLAIHTLADENEGDCLGLVAMARDSALVVPPTMDRNSFFSRIDGLLIGELGDGTAIGTGLGCAVFHLENSFAPRKTIVLITDGENNAGDINPYTAARLVEDKHISLYVLGIGTQGLVPLEYADPVTGHVYSGTLQSEYNGQVLAKIAAVAGGNFFNIETLSALSLAFSSVSKNESIVQSYHIKNYDSEYYSFMLLLAGVFFMLMWVIRRIILQEVL